MSSIILAATIEYNDAGTLETLGVTDGSYSDITGVTLRNNIWYQVLQTDVNWSEAARHPFQGQPPALRIGAMELNNQSRELDFLTDVDIIGRTVTMKRGYTDDTFANLEQVFKARIASLRMEGYGIILELENYLANLSGPIFTQTFPETTPNPQLVGKDKPFVLGRVTQAPVLEYNPQQLEFFTAENAVLIDGVAEGGNPTRIAYALSTQPRFKLLRSPTLPITANFEGPGPTDWSTIIDDDLTTWISGGDTSLTSPYTSQGYRPDGWTLIVGQDGGFVPLTVDLNAGMEIDDQTALPNSVAKSVTSFGGASLADQGSTINWSNPELSGSDTSGKAELVITSARPDVLSCFTTEFASAALQFFLSFSGSGGSSDDIRLESIDLVQDGEVVMRLLVDADVTGSGLGSTSSLSLSPSNLFDQIKPNQITDNNELHLRIRSRSVGTLQVDEFYFRGYYFDKPSVHLRRDLGLVAGQTYTATIEVFTSDRGGFIFGAHNSTEVDWPEHADYVQMISDGGAFSTEKTGHIKRYVIQRSFVAQGSVFNLSYQPAYNRGDVGGIFNVARVRVTDQTAGQKSYKDLVPYIVEQSGYTSSEIDQTLIDEHADSFNDPELGWLIEGDETADQILYRLAGSLNGYIWHDLNGVVKSKPLVAPTNPGASPTPFVIDDSRADPQRIRATKDQAENLRRSVAALRNWFPIPLDKAAGITTTWDEEDRAAVLADYRIVRAWNNADAVSDALRRRYPNAAGKGPLPTALRDAATAQAVINLAMDLFIKPPYLYEVPCYVDVGELDQVATGEVVKCELDFPGLEDTWALVLGRSGTSQPGIVTLTLWVSDVSAIPMITEGYAADFITTDRDCVAWYWNEDGDFVRALEDEKRLQFSPADGSWEGVITEPESKNLLVAIRDFNSGNWTKVNNTNNAKNITGIDGRANQGHTLSDDDGANLAYFYQDVTIPNDSLRVAASVHIEKKLSTSNYPAVSLLLTGGTAVEENEQINPVTGDIAGTPGLQDGSTRIIDRGDWWEVRLWVQNNSSGNTTARLSIYPAYSSFLGFGDAPRETGSIGVDAPQIEHDVAEASLPILRQNFISDSDDFTGVGWSSTGVTVTSNAAVAPDGTTTADEIETDTSTGGHYIFENVGGITSINQVICVYAKANTCRYLVISIGSGGAPWAAIDLETGLVEETNLNPSISVVRNPDTGWCRIVFDMERSAISFALFALLENIEDAGALPGYTGTTKSIYLWRAQVLDEFIDMSDDAAAIGFQKVEDSNPIRFADDHSIEGDNFSAFWNDGAIPGGSPYVGEGTLMLDVGPPFLFNHDPVYFDAHIEASPNTTNLQLGLSGTNFLANSFTRHLSSFVTQWDITSLDTLSAVAEERVTLAFAEDDVVLYHEGQQEGSDSSATVNTTIDKIAIGRDGNSDRSSYVQGPIKTMYFYRKRADEEEIEKFGLAGKEPV